MRIIFAGTPTFAERALAAICAAGHEVMLVLTRVDKPAGRGQRVQPSPVKQLALARGLALLQPTTLSEPQVVQALANQNADAMVVAAYGRLLPAAVLAVPRLGCINIHASMLPRWRGAAPIQRAIEAGDTETGITIMQMDAGLDTGPILAQWPLPIAATQNAADLYEQLAVLGAKAIVSALTQLAAGTLSARPQPSQGVSYAKKLEKSEARLDWRLDAQVLTNRIRAFDPFPGCHTALRGKEHEAIKIWQARPLTQLTGKLARDPATPIGALRLDAEAGLIVACGDAWLQLLELQRPGARRMSAVEFVNGAPLDLESCFAAH